MAMLTITLYYVVVLTTSCRHSVSPAIRLDKPQNKYSWLSGARNGYVNKHTMQVGDSPVYSGKCHRQL